MHNLFAIKTKLSRRLLRESSLMGDNCLQGNIADRAIHNRSDSTDIPGVVGRTEDGNVILAIPIVITNNRSIAGRAISHWT